MPELTSTLELLNAADDCTALAQIKSRDWLVWPILKVHLGNRAILSATQPRRKRSLETGSTVAAAVEAFGRDTRLAMRGLPAYSPGDILLIGARKPVPDANGRFRDLFFDDLADTELAGRRAQFLSYPRTNDIGEAAEGSLGPLLARARVLAKFLAPLEFGTARRVEAVLGGALGTASPPAWRIALDLANFHARRMLFGRFLDRAAPQLIVLTYAPGRMPEIAAARERGIQVLELQHGVTGPDDTDYAWSSGLRANKPHMPLPHCIAAFGELFAEIFLSKGFWEPQEIAVCGSAMIDRGRASAANNRPAPCLTVFSQSIHREEIRRVLGELGGTRANAGLGFGVRVALHPEEVDGKAFYAPLLASLPELELLLSGADPLARIRDSTIVAAYSSLALLEACAMGRLAVSITRADGSGGLREIMPVPGIEDNVPHVAQGSDLAALASLEPVALVSREARSQRFGRRLYASGWAASIRCLAAEMVTRMELADANYNRRP